MSINIYTGKLINLTVAGYLPADKAFKRFPVFTRIVPGIGVAGTHPSTH